MSNSRSKARKRYLLSRVRHQRLRYIAILPSFITLLNGLFGFAAISFASMALVGDSGRVVFHKIDLSYLAMAGYMLFIAMIADMLDGRVARMSHTTSSFGGQLDSLCDMISFGVAPAFLVLQILKHKLLDFTTDAFFSDFLSRFIWLAAAVYMVCAAIRLARFNVENEEDETAHMSFIGLPTPAAAGTIASIVVFYEFLMPAVEEGGWILGIVANILVYSLPFVAIGVAILMISRIRYPHIVNHYLKGRKPLAHLGWGIAALAFFILKPQCFLLVLFCGFAVSGFAKWVWLRSRKSHKSALPEQPEINVSATTDGTEQ